MSLEQTLIQNHQLRFSLEREYSLHILQLPHYELSEWLKEEIEKNPILEYSKENYLERMTYETHECHCPSLYEHLMLQARESFHTEKELAIAEQIIGNLDEKGFFSETNAFSQDPLFIDILNTIQRFHPPGIAAKNIQHALLLQLELSGKQETLAYKIIDKCYDDLIHNRLLVIANKLCRPLKQIKMCVAHEIKTLSLRPANAFRNEKIPYIYPDIIIDETIEVNESLIPSFCIGSFPHPEGEPYIRAANHLIDSLERRRKTLQKVGALLQKKQQPFFAHQADLFEPMTLRDFSKELELHESTVSRAVKDKYLQCPRGIFLIRDFFTFQTKETPTQLIKQKIEELIKSENKKRPYSDALLAQLLTHQGITCARRTIAKHRTELRIPHASQRRMW